LFPILEQASLPEAQRSEAAPSSDTAGTSVEDRPSQSKAEGPGEKVKGDNSPSLGSKSFNGNVLF